MSNVEEAENSENVLKNNKERLSTKCDDLLDEKQRDAALKTQINSTQTSPLQNKKKGTNTNEVESKSPAKVEVPPLQDSRIYPPKPNPQLNPGWEIPTRYELRGMIGSGSYGTVAEAFDHELKKIVAIKRIGRVFEDLTDCKRILREITILNRLYGHPVVVEVIDICVPRNVENFDEIYLVLEIADSDLKKLTRSLLCLSETHVRYILYNILCGLKFIHSAGVIHRDLKPANCLINQNCSVKICDFGLSRTIDPRDVNVSDEVSSQSRKQLTGHVVTRWYRAPELILLQETYSESIDIWSAGCIFAELLGMMEENTRGPLFPGSCCFPLSPDQKHSRDYKFHTKGNRDQLSMIFNLLGTPSEDDIETIGKEDARRYLRLFSKRDAIWKLERRYSRASNDALNLLQKMLQFNPAKRITVEDSIAHPFIKPVRDSELEFTSNCRVQMPFDDWGKLDEEELRYGFLCEIQRYHPEFIIPGRLIPHSSKV